MGLYKKYIPVALFTVGLYWHASNILKFNYFLLKLKRLTVYGGSFEDVEETGPPTESSADSWSKM
jgi:hypothetical protein